MSKALRRSDVRGPACPLWWVPTMRRSGLEPRTVGSVDRYFIQLEPAARHGRMSCRVVAAPLRCRTQQPILSRGRSSQVPAETGRRSDMRWRAPPWQTHGGVIPGRTLWWRWRAPFPLESGI